MENFIVSARKYRPSTFNTVVGQSHITNTLKNAIKTGQLAQAFLFCGPRGVGKTTCARVLAKTINCQNITADYEACGECDSCISFKNGSSMNVHELDAASNNSVDDIRSLVEQVRYAPQSGKFKIYIIDEVHMLSQSAFNAFLKTLEEPPPYAIFILATTEKHKIIPTILSRCQIFDFNRIKVEDISTHLEYIAKTEGITYEQDGLHIIAQKADGALRDACSMFDQITSFSQGNITYRAAIDNLNILDYDYYFKVTDALLTEDISKALLIFDEILDKGFDGNNFINGICAHYRDLLVCKDEATVKLLEVSEGIKQKYLQQAKSASNAFLLSALNIGNQAEINYKSSKNQRLQVELALMKMCHIKSALNISTNQLPQSEVKKKPELVTNTVTTEQPKAADNEAKTAVSPPPVASVSTNTPPSVKKAVSSIPSLKIPSLKNMGSANASEEVKKVEIKEIINPSIATPFTEVQFMQYWKAYAEKAYVDGKMTVNSLMTGFAPKLRPDYTIEVSIENSVQEELLKEEKVILLTYLREKLQNYSIEIISVENTQVDTRKRLYTSTDKFNYLAEKNPNMIELKRRLDLEIDF